VRVNRGICKLIAETGGNFNDYRLYLIARAHFSGRSGIFSINELCDILNLHYGYTSLSRLPGNDRKGFIRRTKPVFDGSFLFSPLSDGRYRIESERKILSRLGKVKRSSWFLAVDIDIILSRRKFADFCVGTMLAGNKFRANRNIAQQCGCTVRRIQYATSRNHRSRLFHKQYNHVEVKVGSHTDVMRTRAHLLAEHGITSPLPRRMSPRDWVLTLNAPNSYRAIVLSGVKGRKAQATGIIAQRKDESWFTMQRDEKVKRRQYIEEKPCRWHFNEKKYDFGRYITDHSMQFDRDTISDGKRMPRANVCAEVVA
jgi:hypothetical protein